MAKNADFLNMADNMISIDHTAAGTLNTGEIALQQDCYGLAYSDLTTGDVGSLVVEADVCEVPKAAGTGLTFSIGDIMWLNPSTLVVHATFATGYIYVGYAREAATATATHVVGRWLGFKRS